jgi:hypothetical protein
VLMGFESAEALGHFQHSGGRPAQRHRGIAPAASRCDRRYALSPTSTF